MTKNKIEISMGVTIKTDVCAVCGKTLCPHQILPAELPNFTKRVDIGRLEKVTFTLPSVMIDKPADKVTFTLPSVMIDKPADKEET